jgi:hypothetical protein
LIPALNKLEKREDVLEGLNPVFLDEVLSLADLPSVFYGFMSKFSGKITCFF